MAAALVAGSVSCSEQVHAHKSLHSSAHCHMLPRLVSRWVMLLEPLMPDVKLPLQPINTFIGNEGPDACSTVSQRLSAKRFPTNLQYMRFRLASMLLQFGSAKPLRAGVVDVTY